MPVCQNSFEKMDCSICHGSLEKLGQLKILGKYPADYLRCAACGFVQVANPHWLAEAYQSAITSTDIGPVWRADYLSRITKSLIHAVNKPAGKFLDYGGGYGLFVRRMRDLGYAFHWLDKYSDNLFAREFVAGPPSAGKYDLVTAFEVLEHFHDPVRQIAEIFEYSSEIFFTTDLIAQTPPALAEWGYYGAEHGQHLAFYTEKSLAILAQMHGLHFYTNGSNLHLFTRTAIHPWRFRLAVKRRVGVWFDLIHQRPSLLAQDFNAGRQRVSASQK